MNNHHNNFISHHSISSIDNKSSMIRKRKRNEKPETISHHLNSLKNLEQIFSNKSKYNNNLNGLKPYSIVSEERCVICKEELSTPTCDTYSCSQCFKNYHRKCLPFISKENNNLTEIICNLCEKHSEGKCFLCNKEINRDS